MYLDEGLYFAHIKNAFHPRGKTFFECNRNRIKTRLFGGNTQRGTALSKFIEIMIAFQYNYTTIGSISLKYIP